MKYLLLACTGEAGRELSPEESAAVVGHVVCWVREMTDRGVRMLGSQLCPGGFAATVRLDGDELMISDGPFAETKEQMAGFATAPRRTEIHRTRR